MLVPVLDFAVILITVPQLERIGVQQAYVDGRKGCVSGSLKMSLRF